MRRRENDPPEPDRGSFRPDRHLRLRIRESRDFQTPRVPHWSDSGSFKFSRPAHLGHPVVNQIKSGYYNGKNPQMCRSTNRQVDTEVWFRIFHLAQEGHPVAPVAAYREQTVEIALGPKGAFENGNIDALRLRAPPSQVVSPTQPDKTS